MKVCSSCGIAKEFDAFAKNSKHSDGRASYCRPCQAIYTKVWREKNFIANSEKKAAAYQANREAVLAQHAEYRAANKERIAEGKKRWRQGRVQAEREYWRLYREQNREYVNQMSAEWSRNNPESRRVASLNNSAKRRLATKVGMSTTELKDWLSYQLMSCAYCGADCAYEFHIDHFVPIARGGNHEHENLRIACPTCNVRKNSRDPYEFMESLRDASAI